MATAPPLPFSSSTSAASLVSLAGDALLPFFTATEARTLRLLSRELRAAVAAFPWADTATVIRGDLARWRACFPRARVANVSGRRDLSDADFAHLAGLHTLDMSWCRSPRLTDAALALAGPGLRVLNMRHCKQPSITGAAFAHLRSLHTLHMDGCTQLGDAALARLVAPGDGSGGSLRVLTMRSVKGVTDAGLQPLRALHTLDMQGCSQEGITDAAFAPLRATLVRLNISECRQATLTDGALAGLCCLRELQASRCAQLTSAAFAHLRLRVLDVSFNRQPELGDAAFAALRGCAERLDMTGCSQATITDAAFANLQGIQELDMSGCNQASITDAAFAHLRGVRRLLMRGCSQPSITDAAFAHLAGGGLEELSMALCSQPGITDAALSSVGATLRKLDMAECSQASLTQRAFAHLPALAFLNMSHCRQFTEGALEPLERAGKLRALKMMECDRRLLAYAVGAGLPVVLNELVKACA